MTISAVILTLNEEQNLPECLNSLRGWCRQIIVVDSGSTDRTLSIAKEHAALVLQHPFETHSKQWNWALKNAPIREEWVLAIDADQRISTELRDEITAEVSSSSADIAGYYLPRKQIFRGQWIRHGGYWPKYLLKLFRRGAGQSDEGELLDFRFYVKGKTRLLKNPLIEQNEKEQAILFWIQKHLRFIELLAQEEYARRHNRTKWTIQPSVTGNPDQRVLWRKTLWHRMPLYIRPFLYFGYRYFIQLGILDGPQGFLFHFLQAFWFRFMVDIRLAELERDK